MQKVEQWPGVESILYLSPEQVLREIENETGDSLLAVLGTNPFPPIIRVQFASPDSVQVDSVVNAARRWAEVSAVSYPRQVWADLDQLVRRIDRWLYILAVPLLIVTLLLTALCLRAQVRYRAATWEFLALLGMSRGAFRTALFTQQFIVGIFAGLASCCVLYIAAYGIEWLLLREFFLPVQTLAVVLLSAVLLASVSGILSKSRQS